MTIPVSALSGLMTAAGAIALTGRGVRRILARRGAARRRGPVQMPREPSVPRCAVGEETGRGPAAAGAVQPARMPDPPAACIRCGTQAAMPAAAHCAFCARDLAREAAAGSRQTEGQTEGHTGGQTGRQTVRHWVLFLGGFALLIGLAWLAAHRGG